eukprot:scaffold97763_cov48-Prasinocladus_malaysianus.AAC.3
MKSRRQWIVFLSSLWRYFNKSIKSRCSAASSKALMRRWHNASACISCIAVHNSTRHAPRSAFIIPQLTLMKSPSTSKIDEGEAMWSNNCATMTPQCYQASTIS